MEDEKFRQELDELFHLFKRMMEKKPMEEMPGVNKMMLQQFQFFFDNYENMKDQIAHQLEGQFGDSVKGMVRQLIEQLRNELGEDEFIIEEKEEESLPEISGTSLEESLKQIDELLKNPDLTEEQINELLDRRAMLQ